MFVCRSPVSRQFFSSPSAGTLFRKLRTFSKMSDSLAAVPPVEIDKGVFKYVLINVFPKDPKVEGSKTIVRGFKRAEYHADIYDEIAAKLHKLSLDTECLGGGRIQHDVSDKKIRVYGYSQGFGRADHSIAVDLIKKQYPEYTVTWDNEGY